MQNNNDAPYPSRIYAWYVVVLLTIAYAISLLDRWILALMVGPVKDHFGVTDTEIGLLMGLYFSLFYVTLGLPFGWFADRYNRVKIISLAMFFWCSMTVMCGLAKNFSQLVFARLGIGLGEAALTPSANSIVTDYFPRSEQSRAISFLNMGVAMGMGFAYLIGGWIVSWMMTQPPLPLPILGALETWQIVFIVAGLPGILVAALVWTTIREPRRRERLAKNAHDASVRKCVAYVSANRSAYLPLFLGLVGSPLVGSTLQWLPTLFDRVWGWKTGQFSFAYGCILLIFGPIGAITGGFFITYLVKQGHKDGPLIASIVAMIILVISTGLLPLATSPEMALCFLIPSTLSGAMSAACGAAAMLFITPGEFRAQISSLYILTINGLGMLIGPLAIGLLNDQFFTSTDGVRWSLMTVIFAGSGVLTVYLASGRQAYSESVVQLEAAQVR